MVTTTPKSSRGFVRGIVITGGLTILTLASLPLILKWWLGGSAEEEFMEEVVTFPWGWYITFSILVFMVGVEMLFAGISKAGGAMVTGSILAIIIYFVKFLFPAAVFNLNSVPTWALIIVVCVVGIILLAIVGTQIDSKKGSDKK